MRVFESNGMFGKIKHSSKYKTFENKSITKNYLIQKKGIKYKIFELKYGNTKVLNVWKYIKVRSVLAVFASAFLY